MADTRKTAKKRTKKKSFIRRHPVFTALILLLLLPIGAVAFLIWGGPLVTDAATFAAGKYFSGLQYLNISFDSLSGNPFDGYTLAGLAVGDKKEPGIVTARKIFFAIDPRGSWEQRKLILSAALDGVRTKESLMNDLISAAQSEFPAAPQPEEPKESAGGIAPLAFVVPQSFSAEDWAGDSGWKLAKFSLDRVDGLIFKVELDAEYQKEKILFDGKAELSEAAMPLWADVRLRALESDVSVQASLKDGLITVKNIEGSLFSSPLKGNASFDSSLDDPTVGADITLKSVDFKRLSKWVPDLGPSTLEGFTAHVTGSLAHPKGQVELKNGNVTWQTYSVKNIQAAADLDGKDVKVNLSADGFGTTVKANGSFALNPDSPLNFKAVAGPLALQDLGMYIPEAADAGLDGSVSAEVTATGTISKPLVHVSVSSPAVTVQKSYKFSDIAAAVSTDLSKLTVENVSLRAFNGSIAAHGTVGLEGSAPSLALEGRAERIDLGSAVPGGTVKGIFDGNFTVGGTAARPVINLASRIDTLDAAQFGAKDIELAVNGSDTLNIQISGLTKMDTPFGGGGTVKLPLGGAKSAMDLKFNLDQMKLSELFPNTMKFAGELTLAVLVSGSFDNPHLSAEVSSPEIQVNSFKVVDPKAMAVLNGQIVDIDASLEMGDRRPSVKGKVDLRKGFKCTLDLSAPGIRLDALEPTLAGVVDGRATVKAHGVITEKDMDFSGGLTAPKITASGIPITDINVPFTFKENKVKVPDGVFTLGGSTLHLKADGDVNTAAYTFNLNGIGVDLKKLTDPLKLPAEISGYTDVLFKGKARTGFTTLIEADGQIGIRGLTVDKFPGQAAVAGSNPFKVKTGKIYLNIDDGEVYLMPGTAITAFPDDPIYRFVSVTGTLWKQARARPNLDPSMMPQDLLKNSDDMYHLFLNGSINMRVLNGLLGGLGAVMEAGVAGNITSTQDIASNFLQKFITGSIASQYRDFDIDVAGKDYSEVRVNKLKFDGDDSHEDVDTTDWTEDAGQQKEQQRYSFSYALPLGRDPHKAQKKRLRTEAKEKKRLEALEKAEKEKAEKEKAESVQVEEHRGGDN